MRCRVEVPVAIDEWMGVDESERDGSRSSNRITTTSDCTIIVLNDAAEEISEILRPRADVIGDGLLCIPVVHAYEPALIAEPEFHKACIANDHTLKPFQFVNRDRVNGSVTDSIRKSAGTAVRSRPNGSVRAGTFHHAHHSRVVGRPAGRAGRDARR